MDVSGNRAETPSPIGGYFGLDLPDHGDPFPTAIKYQSGRAALRAVLESANIVHVSLPAYICDSVIRAVVDSGATVETYRLDDSLYPRNLPSTFGDNDALLYVNYFGLCDANIGRLLGAIPHDHLIVDNSQALLSAPTDALATIYSPRKFVGVPDGGLVMTSAVAVSMPDDEDIGSIGRIRHLFASMACLPPHDGYDNFVKAESSLGDTRPLRMSRLSRRMLAGIDMTCVEKRRRANFTALAARLDNYNLHRAELGARTVPLCYPLVVGWEVERLKKNLIEKRIYLPTYWLEARSRVSDGVEHRLINCCLAIPCDQRYTPDQMSCLADEIVVELDRGSAR